MSIIVLNPQQEIIKNQAVHWFLHESSQVFEIDGKTIFTFGGAISVDRVHRKEHISS